MANLDESAKQTTDTGVGKLVINDLFRGDLKRSFGRDLRELYDFYLSADDRARFSRMGRVRRCFAVAFWLLKCLLKRLAPVRRLLLVGAFIAMILDSVQLDFGSVVIGGDFSSIGFGLVLLVLMLELKDKLLAHDELAVGRAVQIALMPSTGPVVRGWDVWLHTQPANDVGGDLVDYLWLDEARLAVVLGDVVGKGLGAALLMAKLQSTVRAVAGDVESLPDVGDKVNRILCRDGIRGRFATLLFLEVPVDGGHLRLLNAGHMPPIVVSGTEVSSPPPVALPVGATLEATYCEQKLEIASGDRVVLYSDGVTEARNERSELFGEEKLHALVKSLGQLSAEETGRRILRAVEAFVGDARQSDDLSLVVLRRT